MKRTIFIMALLAMAPLAMGQTKSGNGTTTSLFITDVAPTGQTLYYRLLNHTAYAVNPTVSDSNNMKADTNYVKITRAFCGTNDNPINANEAALIYDSCNYLEKLDVKLIEMKSTNGNLYEPTGRVLILDTLTLHNKNEGVFYAPDQIVYYTAEHLNVGMNGDKYGYRLVAVKPNGDTVTAQTTMVGNEEFSIETSGVSFQLTPTDAIRKMYFRADGAASLYDVKFEFNYLEQKAAEGVADVEAPMLYPQFNNK